MGTKENKRFALFLIVGSLMIVMGIFVGIRSSDHNVEDLSIDNYYEFEALEDRPPGGKPTDRTDRPPGTRPDRTGTIPAFSDGNNFIYSVAMPNALLVGGFIVLAFVVVFAMKQYNNVESGDTTRRDILSDLYSLDDEVDVKMNANEEPMTATERAYEEARGLASIEEWDKIFETIETHLTESHDYKTNMTSLVRIMLPIRDSGEISLSRRKIKDAMWHLVKVNLLERNQEGEFTFDKDYEKKVSHFLNEMNEHPIHKAKLEEAKLEENDDW